MACNPTDGIVYDGCDGSARRALVAYWPKAADAGTAASRTLFGGTATVSPTHSGRQPMTRRRPTSIALRLAFDHTPFV
jgi:hypothetical protein